jgi:thiamine-phosphate pyrophosphorylase
MTDRTARLSAARLYFIADRLDALPAALRGGVDVFQLRDKSADDDALLAAARTARRLCDEAGALFIVNDRPDLAVAAGADGVHVGQDDVPVAVARAAVGPDAIVGLSTHSPDQVAAAGEAEVDYIGVGPVYATPTKAGRAPVGLGLVEFAARHARSPFFAIGGIDAGNAAAVVAGGAKRIAVVRAIAEADDPEAAALRLRAATDERTQVGIT